jgi:hypothetical protein
MLAETVILIIIATGGALLALAFKLLYNSKCVEVNVCGCIKCKRATDQETTIAVDTQSNRNLNLPRAPAQTK